LRTFGQLKQLWEARDDEPGAAPASSGAESGSQPLQDAPAPEPPKPDAPSSDAPATEPGDS
jgi:uncharacterized protein